MNDAFLYITGYKELDIKNTKFIKHISSNSLIKLNSETKNGKTSIENVKVSSSYPNYRKENLGEAGVFSFTGTKVII